MKRWYEVTGTDHGAVVFAKNKNEAKKLFIKVWEGERVIKIKRSLNTYII